MRPSHLRKVFEKLGVKSVKNPVKHISAVIPLYNHASYIEDAIASVLQQEHLLEIIVVDDGSTDKSLEITQRLAEADNRIKVYAQQNQGAHAAINFGIGRAQGEWVSILNSDDVYHRDRFSVLTKAIQRQPDVDIFATRLTFLDDSSKSISNDWYSHACLFAKSTTNLANALLNGNFLMTTSNFLIRRSLVQEIGGFEPLRYAHDLEFLVRALALKSQLVVVDESLLSYRLHATNTIKENHQNVRLEWAIVAAKYFLLGRASGVVTQESQKELFDILSRHNLLGPVLVAVAELCTSGNLMTNDVVVRLASDPARSAILEAV